MYIESIKLEGFKSYAVTTVINDFDTNFNAITGLNGTGKSNILDAICFVLGITRLDRVRVKSMKDLICKSAEGEHRDRASVTVTFNNTSPTNRPVLYKDYAKLHITRQINKDGHTKYLLNNTNIQNNKVQDLFKSVQLNVNNPHFLIMQGRITQVINMKPPELLSMLEEASGTSLYEEKKAKSERIMANKNAKLLEISRLIKEDISPTLDKLTREKEMYMKFKIVQQRCEELTKQDKAFRFLKLVRENEVYTNNCEDVKKNMKQNEEKVTAMEAKVKEIESVIERMKEAEDGSGTKAALEGAFSTASKLEAKAAESLKQCQNNIKEEIKRREETKKGLEDDRNHMQTKVNSGKQLEEKYSKLKEAAEEAEKELALAEKRLQDAHSGLFAAESGETASLEEQLRVKTEQVSGYETQIKQGELHLKHNRNELKKKQTELANTSNNYQRDKQSVDQLKAKIDKIQKEMKKVEASGQKAEQLETQQGTLEVEVQRKRGQSDQVQRRIQDYVFTYDDPYRNFDRSKIKGTIAENFSVKDPAHSVALEVAAGGKMRNVIVDATETGKLLIKNKCIRTRTTFIPLDKIQPSGLIDDAQLKKAQEVAGKDNIWPALSLIEYSNDVETAMKFAFGSIFICTTLDKANKVCFHPAIRKKVVTLQGDVCDPSGIMSGGARKVTEALNLMREWRSYQSALKGKSAELIAVRKQLEPLRQSAEVYQKLKSDLDLNMHQLQLEEKRIASTAHHQLEQEVNELKRKIEEGEASIKENKQLHNEGKKRLDEMQKEFKNADDIKKKAIKKAENEHEKWKAAHKKAKANWEGKEKESNRLTQEIDALKKGIEKGQETLQACEEAIRQYEEEKKELAEDLKLKKQATVEAKSAVEKKKEEIKKHLKQIEDKDKEMKDMKQGIADANLENKTYSNDLDRLKKAIKQGSSLIAQKRRQDPWIRENEQYFGVAGTEFSFENHDENQAAKELESVKEQYDKIKKNVNPEAMKELGNTEEKYKNAVTRREQVERDKAKIIAVIKDLDEKKKVKLQQAFKQVNQDLQDNFSTFLKDAKAELVMTNKNKLEDGIEFKVSFGTQVRSSTSELSGGQKSLVALSLILAMLQLNPAPIYILDEVDSALDMAHTQNIGSIIKRKFTQSQFIIVSLKEGMFSNANVLFRTKFQQGSSHVDVIKKGNKR